MRKYYPLTHTRNLKVCHPLFNTWDARQDIDIVIRARDGTDEQPTTIPEHDKPVGITERQATSERDRPLTLTAPAVQTSATEELLSGIHGSPEVDVTASSSA